MSNGKDENTPKGGDGESVGRVRVVVRILPASLVGVGNAERQGLVNDLLVTRGGELVSWSKCRWDEFSSCREVIKYLNAFTGELDELSNLPDVRSGDIYTAVFMGASRQGKSTAVSYLAGTPLVVSTIGGKKVLTETNGMIKAGLQSYTCLPTAVSSASGSMKFVAIDTPGVDDNSGSVYRRTLINYVTAAVLSRSHRFTLVLCASYSQLTSPGLNAGSAVITWAQAISMLGPTVTSMIASGQVNVEFLITNSSSDGVELADLKHTAQQAFDELLVGNITLEADANVDVACVGAVSRAVSKLGPDKPIWLMLRPKPKSKDGDPYDQVMSDSAHEACALFEVDRFIDETSKRHSANSSGLARSFIWLRKEEEQFLGLALHDCISTTLKARLAERERSLIAVGAAAAPDERMQTVTQILDNLGDWGLVSDGVIADLGGDPMGRVFASAWFRLVEELGGGSWTRSSLYSFLGLQDGTIVSHRSATLVAALLPLKEVVSSFKRKQDIWLAKLRGERYGAMAPSVRADYTAWWKGYVAKWRRAAEAYERLIIRAPMLRATHMTEVSNLPVFAIRMGHATGAKPWTRDECVEVMTSRVHGGRSAMHPRVGGGLVDVASEVATLMSGTDSERVNAHTNLSMLNDPSIDSLDGPLPAHSLYMVFYLRTASECYYRLDSEGGATLGDSASFERFDRKLSNKASRHSALVNFVARGAVIDSCDSFTCWYLNRLGLSRLGVNSHELGLVKPAPIPFRYSVNEALRTQVYLAVFDLSQTPYVGEMTTEWNLRSKWLHVTNEAGLQITNSTATVFTMRRVMGLRDAAESFYLFVLSCNVQGEEKYLRMVTREANFWSTKRNRRTLIVSNNADEPHTVYSMFRAGGMVALSPAVGITGFSYLGRQPTQAGKPMRRLGIVQDGNGPHSVLNVVTDSNLVIGVCDKSTCVSDRISVQSPVGGTFQVERLDDVSSFTRAYEQTTLDASPTLVEPLPVECRAVWTRKEANEWLGSMSKENVKAEMFDSALARDTSRIGGSIEIEIPKSRISLFTGFFGGSGDAALKSALQRAKALAGKRSAGGGSLTSVSDSKQTARLPVAVLDFTES